MLKNKKMMRSRMMMMMMTMAMTMMVMVMAITVLVRTTVCCDSSMKITCIRKCSALKAKPLPRLELVNQDHGDAGTADCVIVKHENWHT